MKRRRVEFTYRNFKGQPTRAQAIIEGDNANLNRLFMLLCNHPRVDEVTQHDMSEQGDVS